MTSRVLRTTIYSLIGYVDVMRADTSVYKANMPQSF
jgi:hypothetical protein